MNFLGVGPGELILIFIITLIVVGPERLPGLARQVGRGLVRVRNWMQTSPDAALVLRARQELEQELAQIRSSLLEVQNVRDEVLDVAKQIDEAVSPIASIRPPSLSDLIKEPADKPQPRTNNGQAAGEPEHAADESQPATPMDGEAQPVAPTDGESLVDATADELSAASVVTEAELSAAVANGEPLVDLALDASIGTEAEPNAAANGAQSDPTPPALSSLEHEELGLRIQAIMADLNALQEQLRRRGLLDADWHPPSWAMQLPGPPPETPIEEADR
jgi:sec-independent protein translocase protein TatB